MDVCETRQHHENSRQRMATHSLFYFVLARVGPAGGVVWMGRRTFLFIGFFCSSATTVVFFVSFVCNLVSFCMCFL